MTEKEKMLAGEIYNANYNEELIERGTLEKIKCSSFAGAISTTAANERLKNFFIPFFHFCLHFLLSIEMYFICNK